MCIESPPRDNREDDTLASYRFHPSPALTSHSSHSGQSLTLASRSLHTLPRRTSMTPPSGTNSLTRPSSSQGVRSCCSSMSIDSGMSDSEDVWVDPDETFSLDLGPEYATVSDTPPARVALASPALSYRALPERPAATKVAMRTDRGRRGSESSVPPSVPPMSRIRCELSSREREKLHVTSSVPPSLPPRPRHLSSEDRSVTLGQIETAGSSLNFRGGVSLSQLDYKDRLALAHALTEHGSVTLRRSTASGLSTSSQRSRSTSLSTTDNDR